MKKEGKNEHGGTFVQQLQLNSQLPPKTQPKRRACLRGGTFRLQRTEEEETSQLLLLRGGNRIEELTSFSSTLDPEGDYSSERDTPFLLLVPLDLLEVLQNLGRERSLDCLLLSVGRESWVRRLLDGGVSGKESRDGQRVPSVLESSNGERLETSKGEIAVEGRRDISSVNIKTLRRSARTVGVEESKREGKKEDAGEDEPGDLELLELPEDVVETLPNDESSHENVRVSVDVLGDGVKDDVDALRDRVGEVGRGESRVDEDEGFGRVGLGDSDESRDRDDPKGWVGGRLDPDQLEEGERERERRDEGGQISRSRVTTRLLLPQPNEKGQRSKRKRRRVSHLRVLLDSIVDFLISRFHEVEKGRLEKLILRRNFEHVVRSSRVSAKAETTRNRAVRSLLHAERRRRYRRAYTSSIKRM